MGTRQQYLDEILDYLDAYMGVPYASNLHDIVVKGLCPEHRQALGQPLPPASHPPAKEMGDLLMRRAAAVSNIPTRSVWQVDADLKERFVAVYTCFVYAQASGKGFSDQQAPFRASEVEPDSSDPWVN